MKSLGNQREIGDVPWLLAFLGWMKTIKYDRCRISSRWSISEKENRRESVNGSLDNGGGGVESSSVLARRYA